MLIVLGVVVSGLPITVTKEDSPADGETMAHVGWVSLGRPAA